VRLLIVALVAILTAGATAGGVAGQRVSGVPVVGVLVPGSPEHPQGLEDFRQGMHSLGWTEGSNVSIEARFANGDPALLSANAAEFAAAKVDVIVAFATLATQAAHQATSTIPIVTSAGDPYYGLVQPQRYLRGGSAAGWHPHGRVPSAPRTIKFGPPMLRMALPALSTATGSPFAMFATSVGAAKRITPSVGSSGHTILRNCDCSICFLFIGWGPLSRTRL